MRLQQKIVLVTAATRGIGLACVEACAREGAQVFLAARDLQRGEQAAAGLCKQGLQVQAVYSDAARPETLSAVVEDVVHKAGRLDVLVNNFGFDRSICKRSLCPIFVTSF
jgi:NAD(P)-dependent dehydrogenase (short-subunit alcohol dehydrogenase family)